MNEENAKRLLFDVADALEESGLPFCLGSGTLLGAIREDRFIPIDQDIDLWARAEEFEPLVPQIVAAMESRGLKTEVIDHRHAGYWDGRPYAIKFSGHGEHGDLAASTLMPGGFRYCPKHGGGDPYCIVFDAVDFEPYSPKLFYDRVFSVPNHYRSILFYLYDQWLIPDTVYEQPCKRLAWKYDFLTKQDIVYVPMCLDVLHPGHLNLLKHASGTAGASEGNVWVGLLSDDAIGKYKDPPLFDYQARREIAWALRVVDKVVCQEDYLSALLEHKPAYVVHGDDWKEGPQEASRQLVLDLLPHWGGKLVEVPYTQGYSSSELKEKAHDQR
jgi:phosphoenolpyruvate phosphomutase